MAQDKNSIIVYSDWIKKFESLTDDEAGRLIKHFFRYVNDLNPVAPDRITEIAFIDIEQCLIRDLQKWKGIVDDRSENGRLGNLKRWNLDLYKQVKSAKLTIEKAEQIAKDRKTSQADKTNRKGSQNIASIAVNDSVSVNDSVNENKRKEEGSFTPPSLSDVLNYFKENGYNEQAAQKAFLTYSENNWFDTKNNKIKNWKLKMQKIWFEPENKEQPEFYPSGIPRGFVA